MAFFGLPLLFLSLSLSIVVLCFPSFLFFMSIFGFCFLLFALFVFCFKMSFVFVFLFVVLFCFESQYYMFFLCILFFVVVVFCVALVLFFLLDLGYLSKTSLKNIEIPKTPKMKNAEQKRTF